MPLKRLPHTRPHRALVGALIASAMLTGCGVRYVARVPGMQPGYEEQRLGDATYQVRIGEAWPKDWPDLEKFAMYRAAELTEQRGFRYFQVLNASSAVNSYALPSTAVVQTSGMATRTGTTVNYTATSVTTTTPGPVISGGWYTLDFKMLSAEQAREAAAVVEAAQVKQDLRYFIDSRR